MPPFFLGEAQETPELENDWESSAELKKGLSDLRWILFKENKALETVIENLTDKLQHPD